MSSTSAVKQMKESLGKLGYTHLNTKPSNKRFGFAGGASQRSAGKHGVFCPTIEANTFIETIDIDDTNAQTPPLMSIEQMTTINFIHFTQQAKAIFQKSDGSFHWVKLRTSAQGHQYMDMAAAKTWPVDMNMTVEELLEGTSSRYKKQKVMMTKNQEN